MDLHELRLVSRHVHPVLPGETHAAATALATRLPQDYVDLVERYGQGTTCGYVRVHVPAELVTRTQEWRERVTEYWFWSSEGTEVTPEALQTRGVVVADTIDGDELCFLAGEPERCFVLPRHSDDVVALDGGLTAALAWVAEQFETPLPSTFESWTGRRNLESWNASGDGAAVGRDLLALGMHDRADTDDDHLQLLVPAIGGVLNVVSGGGARVYGSYDDDAPEADVRRVLAVLERHRLTPRQA